MNQKPPLLFIIGFLLLVSGVASVVFTILPGRVPKYYGFPLLVAGLILLVWHHYTQSSARAGRSIDSDASDPDVHDSGAPDSKNLDPMALDSESNESVTHNLVSNSSMTLDSNTIDSNLRDGDDPDVAGSSTTTLASQFIFKFSIRGRLIPLFPLFGMALIIFDVWFNLFYRNNLVFRDLDLIVLGLGVFLVAYNYVPNSYSLERDFCLILFLGLFLLLLLPMVFIADSFLSTGGNTSIITEAIGLFLAYPATLILNFLGIWAQQSDDLITFLQVNGVKTSFRIGPTCAGIYSLGLFISAFFAFVSVMVDKLTRRIAILLTLGVVCAWFANVLRIVIIFVFSHLNGKGSIAEPWTGIWVHEWIGELIFILWVCLFWLILFRFGFPSPAPNKKDGPANDPRSVSETDDPANDSISVSEKDDPSNDPISVSEKEDSADDSGSVSEKDDPSNDPSSISDAKPAMEATEPNATTEAVDDQDVESAEVRSEML